MGARWSGDAAAPSTETEQPNDAAKYKEPIAQSKTDGLQKPNVFSKDSLEFSFGSGIDGGEGNDEIVITNHKAVKVKYKIEAAPSTQCVITANPATGSIAPGKDKKVKLKADVKDKVNLNFKLTVHVGTEAHFLNVRVRSVTGVFGTDPATLDMVEDEELLVPEVLVLMKKSLLMSDGLKSEGIFRLAGDVFEIAALKDQMNKKTFEKSDNINTIATLIKVWFRELPEPILNKVPTEAIYYSSDQDKCVDAYRDLPEPSKTLLTWLLDLLCMTTAHSSVNRMTPQNLAIVVAPNLYDSASSDPMEGLVLSQKCVQFLNNVLLWYLEKKTGSVPEHVPSPAIPIQRARDDSSATPSPSKSPAKRKISRNQTEFGPSSSGGAEGRKSPASPRSVKRQKSTAPGREVSSSVSVKSTSASTTAATTTSPTSPRAHAATVSEGVPNADTAVPVGITRPPPPMTPPPARWGSAGSINITPLSASNPEIKKDDATGKSSFTPGSSPRGNSPRHMGTSSSPTAGSNTIETGGSSPDMPRQNANPSSLTPVPSAPKGLTSLPPPGSPSPTRVASSGSVSSGSSSPRPTRVMSPRSGRPSEAIPRTSSFSITSPPPLPLTPTSTSQQTSDHPSSTPGTPGTPGRAESNGSLSSPSRAHPALPLPHTPPGETSSPHSPSTPHIPGSPKPDFLRNMPPAVPTPPSVVDDDESRRRDDEEEHVDEDEASPRLVDTFEVDEDEEDEDLPGGIPITVPFSSLPAAISASPPVSAHMESHMPQEQEQVHQEQEPEQDS